MAKPWEPRWTNVINHPSGAQALTYLTTCKDTGAKAILKRLRGDATEKAHARMGIEAVNLSKLKPLGGKVPELIETNAQLNDSSVTKYIVMERIEGETLEKLIQSRGKLSFDESISLVKDVGATIELAHSIGIQHRDLKPDNLVVRSMSPIDVYVVDFGLSFNEFDNGSLTGTGETFHKRFLALPERLHDSGNRRDPRSDVTDLVGLLYYCLSGIEPRVLSLEGKKPHERQPVLRSIVTADLAKLSGLDSIFSRGFSESLDSRFQSASEFLARLTALELAVPAQDIDLDKFLAEANLVLHARDPVTIFERRTMVAKQLHQTTANLVAKVFNNASSKHDRIIVTHAESPSPEAPGPRRIIGFVINVTIQGHQHQESILFEYHAGKSECEIWKKLSRIKIGEGGPFEVSSWAKILIFDGDKGPDQKEWERIVKNEIADAVRRLSEIVLSK